MAFIKWQDEFLVGIPKVDEQHRKLLETINDLHLLLHTRVSPEKLKDIVFFLNEYVVEHFGTEEALMKASTALPEKLRERHFREHRFFVDKIQEFTGTLETESANKEGYLLDIFEFLGHWFADHILKIDKETAAYLRQDRELRNKNEEESLPHGNG